MILYPVAQKMDDDNKMPSLVGDDANSTAESSLTHSFYSNSLLSMVRREDISDDDLVHRLSIMSSRHDNSSASAMVTRELMMASYRHQIDIMDKAIHEDDDEIRNLLDMAKRLQMDPDITSDASEFSFHQDEKKQSKLHMQKLPDPPGENESEPGMTTILHRNNNAYVSASNPPHFLSGDRYRRMNTEENQKMRAQNGTRVDSKQQCIRRKTDPLCYYREEQSDNHKRKPDPIGAGTNNSDVNSATYSEQDADSRRLVALARRISKSGGIEDTSSIEGPNDEEYWAKTRGRSVNRLKGSGRAVRTSHNTSLSGSRTSRNSRHSGGSGSSRGSSGANRQGSRQSSSSKEAHDVINVEKKQQKGMKKALLQFFSGKSDRKLVDSSLSAEGINIRRQKGTFRTSSRSNSRSNSRSSSLSSNDSRQSSMKSVNSRYSSSSRRRKHKNKDTSKLTVAEAVYYLNNTERRMTKSTSVSSLKSHTSKKSSASKMSSTSRTSRKSTRSFVSRESNNKKSTTVSKVISAASGLKGKIRRYVVSEKKTTDDHSSDYSDDGSSSFSSSVYS